MKKIVLGLALTAFVFGCKETKKEVEQDHGHDHATETPKEEKAAPKEEWNVLFDGSSFKGWHGYMASEVPAAWKLEEGAMVFYPEEKKEGVNYNLVSENEYTNFVLSIDWRIAEGGNSGIFWGVKEDAKFHEAYQTGPEIQVLDNQKHPDAKNGTTHQAGALYDMIAPLKDVTKPAGEWNTCVISINHEANKGSVQLNGIEIVKFPVNGAEWDAMVAKSKFAGWDGFGAYKTGKIAVQDHGDKVSYRNIKIKEIK